MITIGLGLRHDFVLQLQTLAETITVKGEAPVVDTTQAEIAGVVTRQQIETLPLNSRNYLSLALLVPGHDDRRDAVVLRDRQRRRVDDVQRHRQRRRRDDQQLGRGRRAASGSAGGRRRGVQGHQRRARRPSSAWPPAAWCRWSPSLARNLLPRHGVRVLPQQVAQRARRVRDREAGVPPPPVRRQRRRPDSCATACTSSAPSSAPTPTSSTPSTPGSRSSTRRSRARSRCRRIRNLYSFRGDWQMSNSQIVVRALPRERARRKPARAAAASSRQGRDEEIPRRSVVAGHTWMRGTRQLNDFRFQYAYAAFYGYPGGTDVWKTTGEFPAERIEPVHAAVQLPVADLRQQLRLHQPGEPLGIPRHVLAQLQRSQRQGRRRVQLHAVRLGIGGQRRRVGHLHVLARPVLRPQQPGVGRGAHRRGDLQRLDAARARSATRRTTTSAFVQDDWRLLPNVTLNLGLRYERLYGPANEDLDPNDFPGDAAVRRCRRPRRHEQLRPAHRRRLGCRRQRQHGRPRRLRPLLRPHPHARHAGRVPATSSGSRSTSSTRRIPIRTRAATRPSSSSRRRRPTSPSSPTTWCSRCRSSSRPACRSG